MFNQPDEKVPAGDDSRVTMVIAGPKRTDSSALIVSNRVEGQASDNPPGQLFVGPHCKIRVP